MPVPFPARVVLLLAFFGPALWANESRERWLAEVFGVTHSGGRYSIPTRADPVDFLNEGADRVEALGTGTLKLWFNNTPERNYPNFSLAPALAWPAVGKGTATTTLAGLARLPFYRAVFERPAFNTFFLVATEFARVNWRDGLSATEEAAVIAEFQELTEYLLNTYDPTAPTFILQNWEGDNLLNLDQFPDTSTWPAMAEGLIRYMKARQHGVELGRAAVPASRAHVWNAFEINYNWGALRDGSVSVTEEWTTLNCIVAAGFRDFGLQCDLYSWSAWSAKSPGEEYRLLRGLDYMRARIPTTGPFGAEAIVIGEFGAVESTYFASGARVHSAASDTTYSNIALNQFSRAWRWGVRRAVFWQIYDNGTRNGVDFDYANPVSKNEQDFVGSWLIRPPGPPEYPNFTYTGAHDRFAALMDCRLLEDALADFSQVDSLSDNWAGSDTAQSWAPGFQRRIYRADAAASASLTYRVGGDLVDCNVTAFLYGTDQAAGRLCYFLSGDGAAWQGPFDFAVVDTVALDTASPDWRRLLLGPGGSIPSGTRYLRIEISDPGVTWRTQIADLKLISRGLPPTLNHSPTSVIAQVGQPVTFTADASGPGPLRYRWRREGVVVQDSRASVFTLASASPADAGDYVVEVSNYAGHVSGTPVTLKIAADAYEAWRLAQFSADDLADDAISGATADPDGDGVPNLLAFALGRTPGTTPGDQPPALAAVARIDQQDYFTVAFTRTVDLAGATLTCEFSDTPSGPWTASNLVIASTADGTVMHLVMRDTEPLSAHPRRFARLRVDR